MTQSHSTAASNTVSQATTFYYAGVGGLGGDMDAAAHARAEAKLAQLLGSESFSASAHTLERMVTQNELHPKHRIYRDVPLGPAGALGAAHDDALPAPGGPTNGRKPRGSHAKGKNDGANKATSDGGSGNGGGGGVTGSHGAGLQQLWSFGCEETRGRNISCIQWNPVATDVLAASYGQFEFDAQRPGLVALWALQTPHHPLRLWRLSSGATSLAFSRLQPHLLAVGLYSGMVEVYDVRWAEGKPISESHPISGKHNEPVWQLRWVERLGGAGGDENLISVSTNGRVTQWALKKGLERTDLMKLKRLSNVAGASLGRSFAHKLEKEKAEEEAAKGGKNEKNGKPTNPNGTKPAGAAAALDAAGTEGGIISRRAAGLSVDFSPLDASIYICGARTRSSLPATPKRSKLPVTPACERLPATPEPAMRKRPNC
jgi:hypothetical protein